MFDYSNGYQPRKKRLENLRIARERKEFWSTVRHRIAVCFLLFCSLYVACQFADWYVRDFHIHGLKQEEQNDKK